jgi:hypothetical protein
MNEKTPDENPSKNSPGHVEWIRGSISQGLELNNHQYRLPHTTVCIPYHYHVFRICPWPATWLTSVEVITFRLAPVYQPVSGTLWLLSTKFRRWLLETQYLYIPCSICIYQNAGVGAMMCLYRIGVESTLCCMYIRQMCRICVESGLFDSCNPGLLLLGSER